MKRIVNIFCINILLVFISCTNEHITPSQSESDSYVDNKYDTRVMDFAEALNRAVSENSDMRKLIKQEVLKQFDGDYDLLLKDALAKSVKPSESVITKSGCSEALTVKELLSLYYTDTRSFTKSEGNPLDELVNDYPELQVSVPVHADSWDPDSYVPDIAVIPSDFEEFVTETITALNAEGEEVQIDAINEPDNPTIVVGLNERISPAAKSFILPISSVRARLELQLSEGAVRVEAFASVPVDKIITRIDLYRSSANSNEFTKIGNIDLSTMIYNDYDIIEDCEYTYYIEVYARLKKSVVSNIKGTSSQVTIKADTSIPNPVLNLYVRNEYAETNLVYWDNPANESYYTQIHRTTPDAINELLATLEPTVSYYYDDDVIPGEKWTYFVTKINKNTNGLSAARKTYIYNPYRNPSGTSKVMLKKIHLDCNAVEVWVYGKPEIYLTTYGHRKDNAGNLLVDTLSTIDYKFPSRSDDADGLNALMADWSFFDDNNYYPVLNIGMREYDAGTASVSINVGAKCGYKYADYIDLVTVGSFKYEFANKSRDCGTVMLRYYEYPEQTLTFSNYDSYIEISEEDDNN